MDNFFCKFLKRLGFALLFISGIEYTYSQSPLRNDIIPHSPEAEALAKFVTTPVTLYAGTPAIAIPVYDIKSSKLSLSISLNYNYNGYRPGEEASWAGLGWSLSAGGGITRIVKGLVDHVDGIPVVHGWYDDYVDIIPVNNNQEFLHQAGTGLIDLEPDLYIFNFIGYSGKFNWINGRAVMYPHQDLKIEKIGTAGTEIFMITVQDGTIYTFGEREMTYHGKTNLGAEWIPQHTSAWFMTKIQSPDKTDEINFTYAAYNYTQPVTYIDNYTITSVNGSPGNNTANHLFTSTGFAGSGIQGKQLSQIISKTATVTFQTEATIRKDLPNNTSKALKKIQVTDNTGILKNISLVHNYFSGSSLSGTRITKLNLKEVDISAFPIGTNETDLPEKIFAKYLFDYNSESANFPVQTRAIDYWGYYNGATLNQSLFPNVNFISPALPIVGSREANSAFSTIGILNKITYPSSGYTIFNYEPNYTSGSSSTAPNNFHIGVPFNAALGNPTTAQTPFSITNNQSITITFGRTITSQYPYGVLNNLYILQIYKSDGTLVYTCPRLGKQETDATATLLLNSGNYYYKVTCENTSTYTYGNIASTQIVAGPQNIPFAGMRVKNIQSYDNINGTSPSLTKSYSYTDNGGYSTLIQLARPGIREQDMHHVDSLSSIEQIYSEDNNSSLSGLLDEQYFYKSVSEVNYSTTGSGKTQYDYQSFGPDVSGVFLKKQTEFKNNSGTFIPIKITDNNYDILNKKILTAYRSTLSGEGRLVYDPDNDDPYYRLEIYKVDGLYTLPSSYKQLNNSIVTTYDQNGTNPITSLTNYYYDNPLYQFPTRTITKNSKGEDIITEMKYPLDYIIAGCSTSAIESTYNTDKLNATNAYNSCTITRSNALSNSIYGNVRPYYPNTAQNNTMFSSIVNANPCENNFKIQSQAAYLKRNTAYNEYNACLIAKYPTIAITSQKAIVLMQKNHIISPVIEQYISIRKSGVDNLVSATKTDYKIKTTPAGYDVAVPDIIYKTEMVFPVLRSTFVSSPATYYKVQAGFTFDNNVNLTEQHKVNDASTSYLWDYNNLYPVAEVINAGVADTIAYSSFEADSKGRFAFTGIPIIDLTAPTGRKSYLLSSAYPVTKTVASAVAYVVSLWSKSTGVTVNGVTPSKNGRTINGWTYREWKVSGQSTITISCVGSIGIDELRLYPASAQMNSFTYLPGKGLTTKCDINSGTSYFVYDCMYRLQLIKDQNKNILKRFCYNYVGEPIDCGAAATPFYENNLMSTSFTRNNCGAGYLAGVKDFIVQPGTFTSTISQAAADQQAVTYTNANGQTYANINASCTPVVSVGMTSYNYIGLAGFNAVFTNVSTSQKYTFAVSSLTGSQTLGTLNNGTYNITISKPSNTFGYMFSLGNCNDISIGGTMATFNNITINKSGCNTVIIDNY